MYIVELMEVTGTIRPPGLTNGLKLSAADAYSLAHATARQRAEAAYLTLEERARFAERFSTTGRPGFS